MDVVVAEPELSRQVAESPAVVLPCPVVEVHRPVLSPLDDGPGSAGLHAAEHTQGGAVSARVDGVQSRTNRACGASVDLFTI